MAVFDGPLPPSLPTILTVRRSSCRFGTFRSTRGTLAIIALTWTLGCSAGDPSTTAPSRDGIDAPYELESIELNDGADVKNAEDASEVQSVQQELASCNPPILWCVYPYWDLGPCHGGVICRSGSCSFDDCKRVARRICGNYNTICNIW